MRVLALLVAAILAIGAWLAVESASANLPTGTRLLVMAPVVGIAVVMGLIFTAAVGRRQRTGDAGLFAGVALIVAGGVVGAVMALTLTAGYLWTYGTWPDSVFDRVLMVAAFPIFGALGACLGCLLGLAFGVVVGGAFRLAGGRR